MHVEDALKARKSIRAFRPDPVPREVVEELLELASRSPSGTNVQSWKMYVVAGEVRKKLEREVLAYRESNPTDDQPEYATETRPREPYISRMRKLGKDMYTLLEIPKGDKVAGWNQWGRNYKFFDAPVGLIFTIDKDLGRAACIDLGLFMQSFMLAATSKGLDTCAQGAWNFFWRPTRKVLEIPDDEYIMCGMSLGYADPAAPVNSLISERVPYSQFARLRGFD